METSDAWKAFVICLVLLFLKGLATSIYLARLRIKNFRVSGGRASDALQSDQQ